MDPVYFRSPRNNGWYVAQEHRKIKRGKNKGRFEVRRNGRKFVVDVVAPIKERRAK